MSKLSTLSRFRAPLTSTFQKKVIIFRPATPQLSRVLQWLFENGQINSGSQKIGSLAVQGFGSQSLHIQHYQLSKESVCLLSSLG